MDKREGTHELTDDIPGLKWVGDPKFAHLIEKQEIPEEEIDEQDRESWVAMAIALGHDVEE